MEWKKQGKAREQRPLATSLNDEQMFFMSYAQVSLLVNYGHLVIVGCCWLMVPVNNIYYC